MASRNVSAQEAADAVNQLMHMDPQDQLALLEVIDDFFCPPCHDSSDSDSDSDTGA